MNIFLLFSVDIYLYRCLVAKVAKLTKALQVTICRIDSEKRSGAEENLSYNSDDIKCFLTLSLRISFDRYDRVIILINAKSHRIKYIITAYCQILDFRQLWNSEY